MSDQPAGLSAFTGAERPTRFVAAELRAAAAAGGGLLMVEAAVHLQGLLDSLGVAETDRDQAREQSAMLLRIVRKVHGPLAAAFEDLAGRQPWSAETRAALARLLETFELSGGLRDEHPGPPMPRIGLPQFTLFCAECGIDHCTRCHDEHRCATCNTTVGHTAGYHCTSCKDAAKRVADWNRDFPVGTPVRYISVLGSVSDGDVTSKTRQPAWVADSGHAVVMIEGVSSWVSLRHVSSLVDPTPSAAEENDLECADAPDGEHHLHPLSYPEEQVCCYCNGVFPRPEITL